MFKQILFLISISYLALFAQPNTAQIISAVKQNPALLDTPRAKIEMEKRGIDKSVVLDKIEKIEKQDVAVQEDVDNKIDEKEKSTLDENNIEKKKNLQLNRNASLNPLRYIKREQLLNLLKLKQKVNANKNLPRYGMGFFRNKNKLNAKATPVPDYYTLNNLDTISIWLYGAKNKNILVVVDKNGNINIPKVGPLKVAGKKFSDVRKTIIKNLEKNYSNTSVSVDLDSHSTIQVNLVGDLFAPGVYHVSSLSTIKDLLIISKGVKDTGSLREILLKRDGKVLAKIDFYKLLKNGDSSLNIILRPNDTIFIPTAKKLVSINGEVTNPAKFELKKDETLKDLLSYAGDIKYSGSKYGLIVKRYINNQKEKVLEVDLKDAKSFKLFNGDRVYVRSIDKLHNESIYLYGNVVRPGERELTSKNSLKELLTKEISKLSLKGVFLENTLFNYALIKRKTIDLEQTIERVNLGNILNKDDDFKLQNDDEIYIFNKYNSNITPYVTITGKPVAKKGKYNHIENITISDIINQAGATPYSKIKLTTYNTNDLMPRILFVDETYKLSAFDEIELFDYYMVNHVKTFSINGEINLPNRYTLNENMTIADAIEIAGDFTKKAYKTSFEVIRFTVMDDKRIREIFTVDYSNINEFILKDEDEISIFRIPNWNERKTVTLKGEVKFPGTYAIKTGEKIVDIIKRAGGFTNEAFIEGAIFSRLSVKLREEKLMRESIHKLKQQITYTSVNAREIGEEQKDNSKMIQAVADLETKSKEFIGLGRITIKLDKDLEKFALSTSNMKLEDKDILIIPQFNDTVSVYGEVLNKNTFIFDPSLYASDYIEKAGGLTPRADNDSIYIILASGDAQKVSVGWFWDSNDDVQKGSSIIIPMKIETSSNILFWKDVSQVVYQLAITAASLNTIGAI